MNTGNIVLWCKICLSKLKYPQHQRCHQSVQLSNVDPKCSFTPQPKSFTSQKWPHGPDVFWCACVWARKVGGLKSTMHSTNYCVTTHPLKFFRQKLFPTRSPGKKKHKILPKLKTARKTHLHFFPQWPFFTVSGKNDQPVAFPVVFMRSASKTAEERNFRTIHDKRIVVTEKFQRPEKMKI